MNTTDRRVPDYWELSKPVEELAIMKERFTNLLKENEELKLSLSEAKREYKIKAK